MKKRIICLIAVVLLGLGLALPVWATDYYGKSLAEWQGIYFEWYYGALNVPLDANGNAVVDKVALMAIPYSSPGYENIVLSSGQAFVLPFYAIVGQSYTDGTAPDNMQDWANIIKTLNLTVKIDGATVIDSTNMMDYYTEYVYNPPVPYINGNVDSNIWVVGIGMVHEPLSIGQHTIQLDAINTIPLPWGYTEWRNTWNVMVPEPASMLLLGLGLMGLAGIRRKLNKISKL